ncbi:odorant receptor 94a-like, partial [Belonocnema kinseyi]|uniref:odorant receptor 94a-like n=1 Tax=Belonocnema kinseyi TaxID=2817044 RepID=UPI00143E0DCC
NKFNKTFEEVLFTQFLASLIVICFSVFKISKGDFINYSTLIMLYTYIVCLLSQLYLYCFYGNELMIDANETKKSLLILMIRSRKPILISACSVTSVNLDSTIK